MCSSCTIHVPGIGTCYWSMLPIYQTTGKFTLYHSQHLLFVPYAQKVVRILRNLCALDDFSISSYLRKFYALSGKLEDMQLGTSCVAVAQIRVPGIGTCDGHRCRIIKQGGLSFDLSQHQLLLHVLKKDARRLCNLCALEILMVSRLACIEETFCTFWENG